MQRIAIGRLMKAISKNVEAQFKIRLSDIDFDLDSNYSYFQYLIVIGSMDGINQNELAKRMNVGKGSASKAVKYLEQNELIIRAQDETDTRIRNVYITEKGRKIADRFKVVFLELNSKLTEGFSEAEVDILKTMLERVYKNTATEKSNFIMQDLGFLEE